MTVSAGYRTCATCGRELDPIGFGLPTVDKEAHRSEKDCRSCVAAIGGAVKGAKYLSRNDRMRRRESEAWLIAFERLLTENREVAEFVVKRYGVLLENLLREQARHDLGDATLAEQAAKKTLADYYTWATSST